MGRLSPLRRAARGLNLPEGKTVRTPGLPGAAGIATDLEMHLIVDPEATEANSRLTGIRLALLTSRCMENWRRGVGDGDQAMILLAVVAITGERLTRIELDDELKMLDRPLPDALRGECNISSIAAATGLNRETTRRKVNALVDAGYLLRSEQGEIAFSPSVSGSDAMLKLMRKQLEAVTRFVNEALREGVVKIS